jgi:HAD superfamily hydrolase (TIGR01509 family)
VSCFDEVIVSADVHLVKPDPAVYRLSADRLGVKLSECIFIDDRKAFADAANDVGMTGLEYLGLANLKQSLSELLN